MAFPFMHYNITVDPVYAVDVLNHMWATEPVGTTSIILTVIGLALTLTFKFLDFCWDWYKEHARQGKLKIELSAEQTPQGELALCAIVSNIGKEPIVVRDVGYAKRRLIGTEFIRMLPPETPLPHALNARDLVRILVTETSLDLETIADQFRIKDSMGKVWDAPDGEIRKAKRQLRVLRATLVHLSKQAKPQRELLEKLQAGSPISTQN